MSDQNKVTDAQPDGSQSQEAQVPADQTDKAETTQVDEAKANAGKKEETIGDVLNPGDHDSADVRETVPLSTHLEIKRESKALAKRVKELEAAAAAGNTDEAVEGLDELANEFPDVDKNFIKKVTSAITAKVKKEVDAEAQERMKPVLEKERADNFNKKFDAHFTKTLEAMPEYKDIVDKEVIRTLTLSPSNRNKTLTQLIEDHFGRFVPGKKAIDSATPSANADTSVDYDKAQNDPTYFKQVMANPALKKQYNEQMTKNVASRI